MEYHISGADSKVTIKD